MEVSPISSYLSFGIWVDNQYTVVIEDIGCPNIENEFWRIIISNGLKIEIIKNKEKDLLQYFINAKNREDIIKKLKETIITNADLTSCNDTNAQENLLNCNLALGFVHTRCPFYKKDNGTLRCISLLATILNATDIANPDDDKEAVRKAQPLWRFDIQIFNKDEGPSEKKTIMHVQDFIYHPNLTLPGNDPKIGKNELRNRTIFLSGTFLFRKNTICITTKDKQIVALFGVVWSDSRHSNQQKLQLSSTNNGTNIIQQNTLGEEQSTQPILSFDNNSNQLTNNDTTEQQQPVIPDSSFSVTASKTDDLCFMTSSSATVVADPNIRTQSHAEQLPYTINSPSFAPSFSSPRLTQPQANEVAQRFPKEFPAPTLVPTPTLISQSPIVSRDTETTVIRDACTNNNRLSSISIQLNQLWNSETHVFNPLDIFGLDQDEYLVSFLPETRTDSPHFYSRTYRYHKNRFFFTYPIVMVSLDANLLPISSNGDQNSNNIADFETEKKTCVNNSSRNAVSNDDLRLKIMNKKFITIESSMLFKLIKDNLMSENTLEEELPNVYVAFSLWHWLCSSDVIRKTQKQIPRTEFNRKTLIEELVNNEESNLQDTSNILTKTQIPFEWAYEIITSLFLKLKQRQYRVIDAGSDRLIIYDYYQQQQPTIHDKQPVSNHNKDVGELSSKSSICSNQDIENNCQAANQNINTKDNNDLINRLDFAFDL